ncbi:MAG: 4'-phosphopantetheinyl transferase superfamily protein [Bacteroidota bacterium]
MHFISNDIISLSDTENQKSFSNERYLRKILTEKEFMTVRQNTSSPHLPYVYWTCKECAYKIAMKKGFEKNFAPQCYEVEISCHEESNTNNIFTGTVLFNETNVFFKTEIFPEHISSVASTVKKEILRMVHFVGTTTGTDQKKVMRTHIIESLSSYFKKEESEFDICKTENGIPYVVIKNCINVPDISFSHDGDYFAYAFSTNNLS